MSPNTVPTFLKCVHVLGTKWLKKPKITKKHPIFKNVLTYIYSLIYLYIGGKMKTKFPYMLNCNSEFNRNEIRFMLQSIKAENRFSNTDQALLHALKCYKYYVMPATNVLMKHIEKWAAESGITLPDEIKTRYQYIKTRTEEIQ